MLSILNREKNSFDIKNDLGKKITLSDSHTKRVLKQDKKGLYVIKGGMKNYVTYHSYSETYKMTGEWDHI